MPKTGHLAGNEEADLRENLNICALRRGKMHPQFHGSALPTQRVIKLL